MIVRMWKATIRPDQLSAYRSFARDTTVPLFANQPGFHGSAFLTGDDDAQAVVSLWADKRSLTALTESIGYREAADTLLATGMIVGTPVTEVFETAGLPMLLTANLVENFGTD